MALPSFLSLLLLFSLVAIASADYDYNRNPQNPNVNHDQKLPFPHHQVNLGHDQPLDKYATPTKPEYEDVKPEGEYNFVPTNHYEQLIPPNHIGIQGLVLCNSGHGYFPIRGAVARIRCEAKGEKGYYTTPYSILTQATDANGYFLHTISFSDLKVKLNVEECQVSLEFSPLESCNIPTDVNNGISGCHLSKPRYLKNKILYNVGPFIYTSAKPYSAPTTPNGY